MTRAGAPHRHGLGIVPAMVSALLLVSAAALAQSASDLERDARAAYDQRKFAVAARGFEAADRADPHASLKLNAALAWEQAGDPARAADDYEAALAGPGLDGEQQTQARARLAKLEQSLAILTLQGPAGAAPSIDGQPAGALPLRAHVLPGDHTVAVSGAGDAQRLTVRAGETRSLVFAVAKKPEMAASPSVVRSAAPAATAQPTSALRIGGWVGVSVGVLAAGAAIGLGVTTLSTLDEFNKTGNTSVDLHDRAVTLRALTNVALGVAAAATIAGVVLHVVAPRPGAAAKSAQRIDVQLSAAHLGARFTF